MGSLWSIWLALDRPAKVAAMTHIGCPAFILGTSAPLPMRLISNPVLGPLLMRLMPPSPKQVMKLAAMAGEDLSAFPEMRDLLVSMQELAGVQPALRELLAAVVRLRGARPQVALTAEQLAQITQPVQLIWGERDPFGAVAIGEQAAATIPRAEFHVVSEAGHIPWLAHASDVGKLATPFLRRHSAAAGEAGDRGSTPRRSPPESPAPGSPLLG
jgi:pimeloyl-ACP methyl ester carboxylesterase